MIVRLQLILMFLMMNNRVSVQVEHVEEKENDQNDGVVYEPHFDDNDNSFVPPSPPVL
jgi:hypothetical protein